MKQIASTFRLFRKLTAFGVVLSCAKGSGFCAATIDFACWAPDRGTPYKWFEGAKEIQSFFAQDYRAAGNLYAYVRNTGKHPLSATSFRLDGRELTALRAETRVVWWRMLPNPIPPGGIGEVIVRPRSPLESPVALEVRFDDETSAQTEIAPRPCPLRIETVGFNASMNRVFLVLERLTGEAQTLSRVSVDGVDVTKQTRLLDPSFSTGVSPLVIKLRKPLAHGSYHVYSVRSTSGAQTGCCIRSYDGWVPLGTYGYGEYEEFARNGCNGHACFGRHSKGDLDSHATLKMRGVSTVGDSAPKNYEVGHPGLWAYYLQDEPDCADYGVNDLPHPLRIGYHAMEMERRRQTCAGTDPSKLAFLTIDMTYKPANYFIYGPVADVFNPDCYPISLGVDATMVREVVETARRGCGPRPLTFTFQGCYEERLDPKDREAVRFPRPPFAEEERLMMYYAIGAGARGLFDYIHCSEMWAGGKVMSHGSKEYPDVWEEIGRVYRELQVVSPYLSLAHPTRLATSGNPKLDISTLLCGEDALLLVCINEDYEQQKQAFKYRSAKEVTLEIPKIPWMRPQSAWRITEHGVKPVALKKGQGTTTIEMDQVDVAEMLLVSSNPKAGEELNAANLKRQQEVGAALLAQARKRQLDEATRRHTFRRLTGEFGDYMVMGSGIEAYGIQDPLFWNPTNEPYWGFEFGDNEAGRDSQKGAEWRMKIPAERVGKRHLLYAVAAAWGQPALLTVVSPQGEEVAKREVGGGGPGALIIVKLRCPIAGDYTVRFLQAGKGPKGGKITHALYVIPEDANPPEGG